MLLHALLLQVWLATGTDFGGSLRNPASYCGVVGMRNTIGAALQFICLYMPSQH
jgi:Asp-tRNA(Asn)/Glu-tRNA(Gln) amidotransferase A subunit family amidase